MQSLRTTDNGRKQTQNKNTIRLYTARFSKRMNTESEFEKFRQFTQKVVAVPKSEIDRREKEYKKARKKRAKRKVL